MTTSQKKTRKLRGHVSDGSSRNDKASKENVPMIDVAKYRYFKVLGKGFLHENQHVVVINAKLVSKTDEKKIQEAGGAVVLTA